MNGTNEYAERPWLCKQGTPLWHDARCLPSAYDVSARDTLHTGAAATVGWLVSGGTLALTTRGQAGPAIADKRPSCSAHWVTALINVDKREARSGPFKKGGADTRRAVDRSPRPLTGDPGTRHPGLRGAVMRVRRDFKRGTTTSSRLRQPTWRPPQKVSLKPGLTCFFLDFAEDAEEGWLHPMAVERVFPSKERAERHPVSQTGARTGTAEGARSEKRR